MATNATNLMQPEASIRVFVRIARETNHTKRRWVKGGLMSNEAAQRENACRDQWISAARIIKGNSLAYMRRYGVKP